MKAWYSILSFSHMFLNCTKSICSMNVTLSLPEVSLAWKLLLHFAFRTSKSYMWLIFPCIEGRRLRLVWLSLVWRRSLCECLCCLFRCHGILCQGHSTKMLYLFCVGIFAFTISIPCVFSLFSDVVQLEIEKDLLLVMLLGLLFSGFPFCRYP